MCIRDRQKGNPYCLSQTCKPRIRNCINDPGAVQNGIPPNQRGSGEYGHGRSEKQENTYCADSGVRFRLSNHIELKNKNDPKPLTIARISSARPSCLEIVVQRVPSRSSAWVTSPRLEPASPVAPLRDSWCLQRLGLLHRQGLG